MKNVIITGENLTIHDLIRVSREYAHVELSETAKNRILESRKIVDDLVENEKVVYGITTGFGKFSNVSITKDESKILQRNLIITHAVGAGEPFNTETTRAIILLRIKRIFRSKA